MKILITTDLFKGTINGVVTSVLNLERELTYRGHEVRILTVSEGYYSYREDNVYYIKSVPSYIYPDIRIPVSQEERYVRELIEWKPDVVHSQCEFCTFNYAKKIAKVSGAVLVHTYHTLYEQYTEYVPIGKQLSRNMLAKWMHHRLRKVDRIIAPTRKVEVTLRTYGIDKTIDIIPSGIALEKYEDPVEACRITALKEKYHLEKDTKVLLCLGRLGFEKRVDELISGMPELVERENRICLLIVGDGPARESLEQKAVEMGVTDHVRFTGMISPQEVSLYYHMADIFVCASTSETQGLTYIEAAASGLPMVCRKDPCLCGVLEEGGNGYTYTDVAGFSEKVQCVLSDDVWRRKAGEHSRNIARRFGTKKFGSCVERSYIKGCVEKERTENEGAFICKEQKNGYKKWSWPRHGYAGRVS